MTARTDSGRIEPPSGLDPFLADIAQKLRDVTARLEVFSTVVKEPPIVKLLGRQADDELDGHLWDARASLALALEVIDLSRRQAS